MNTMDEAIYKLNKSAIKEPYKIGYTSIVGSTVGTLIFYIPLAFWSGVRTPVILFFTVAIVLLLIISSLLFQTLAHTVAFAQSRRAKAT